MEKLLNIAGPAISEAAPLKTQTNSKLHQELHSIQMERNGFYAFESALHFFPSNSSEETSIETWNQNHYWRDAYGSKAEGLWFFAEDVFGGQFCIRDEEILAFDPETGELESLARNFNDFGKLVRDEYEVLTGYPLAHEWQASHVPIKVNHRLCPVIPFVAGGEFSIENLREVEARQGMRLRGDLALQIANLPDGATIDFKIAP